MATFQPADRHSNAAFAPAEPVPITIRSKVLISKISQLPWSNCLPLRGDELCAFLGALHVSEATGALRITNSNRLQKNKD